MKIDHFFHRKPYIIAGPCSAESEQQILSVANSIVDQIDLFRAGVWKPRTYPNSFEGAGEKALCWLKKIQKNLGLKIATEVATANHVEMCLEAGIDVLWIGARTTVNPFYVQEIADALRGVDIPVFVKNPIHPDISLWIGALERINNVGINKIVAMHRGFFKYESSIYRNDPKWEVALELKRIFPQLPILCDSSHIAGNIDLIKKVSHKAMSLNMDGIMIETHHNPKIAVSDSKQQVTPNQLAHILNDLTIEKSMIRNHIKKLKK